MTCLLCDRTDVVGRGLCTRCYQAERKAGRLDSYPRLPRGGGTCEVPGCGRPYSARGYCANHYQNIIHRYEALDEREPIERRRARLDADPLRRLLRVFALARPPDNGHAALMVSDSWGARMFGLSMSSWRAEKWNVKTVDRLCCAIGLHPVLVYGFEEWCEPIAKGACSNHERNTLREMLEKEAV